MSGLAAVFDLAPFIQLIGYRRLHATMAVVPRGLG